MSESINDEHLRCLEAIGRMSALTRGMMHALCMICDELNPRLDCVSAENARESRLADYMVAARMLLLSAVELISEVHRRIEDSADLLGKVGGPQPRQDHQPHHDGKAEDCGR